ncbi:Membrane protein [metagenome]|uniref:Membrane protein n=1 Tax=metagenome TaxID=256318 RepID=A0A2P2C2J2_9ZZZZ
MGNGHDQKRLDRNWDDLLQELRVAQTGVQILTGFLLTVPFSSRFDQLSSGQVRVYLAVLCGGVLTTSFVIAPVAFHRILFRQHEKDWLVEAANQCARIGLVLLAITSSGVLFLVFDVSLGGLPATVALVTALSAFVVLWGALPWWTRREK